MNINFRVPTKIHFGLNKIKDLPSIAKPYGTRCLLVTTNSKTSSALYNLYEEVKKDLSENNFTTIHFNEVTPDPTIEIVEKGIELLKEDNIDFVIAIGGGSSIDTAKTICLLNDLKEFDWDNIFSTYTSPHETYEPLSNRYIPLISVATTAGTGSEVTQAAVITKEKEKNSIFHQLNFPDHAILDPSLLTSLPKKLTASTGLDAFCHAFESYINPNSSVFSELASIEAMENIKECLVKSMEDLGNVEYRSKLLYAQTLAGIGLSNSGAAAPHPIAEIIGGITNISHGESLALILPEFIKVKYNDNIDKFAKVARIFDEDLVSESNLDAAKHLEEIIRKFLKDIDLYHTFDDYGVTEDDFNSIVNCPILGYLPFGSKEELQEIILNSKNNR